MTRSYGLGPRFPVFVRLMAIAIAIAVPAAAFALQQPGTEEQSSGISLERGSNVWFCVSGSTNGGIEEAIDIANPATVSASGRFTIFAGDTRLDSQQLSVPPAGRQGINLQRELAAKPQGQDVSTVLELDMTSVAIAETVFVNRPEVTGTMSAPCTSGISQTRYFPGGSSLRGADTFVQLFNPFPQDAVVSVDIFTDTGVERPNNLTNYPLFTGRRAVLKLSDEVRRRSALGAVVRVERGQVVAEETVISNGERIPAGASLSEGSAAPATEWQFADGLDSPDTTVALSIMNPRDADAAIEVQVYPEGLVTDTPSPISTTVAGQTETTLTIDPGLPAGTRYGFAARSVNGTPVVIDRMIGYSQPPGHGLSIGPGARGPARKWVIAPGYGATPTSPYTQALAVLNPGRVPAHLSVGRLADGNVQVPADLHEIVIPAGSRSTVPISERFPGIKAMSSVAWSDQDLVIESRLTATPPRVGFETTAASELPVGFALPSEVPFIAPTPQVTDVTPTLAPAPGTDTSIPVVTGSPPLG